MSHSEQKLDHYHDYSIFQLKQQRQNKEQCLKSLQRKYHYNMKLLARRKKQKINQMEKQIQRQNFQHHKRLFSDHLLKMKRQQDHIQIRKKKSMKHAVQLHREQKSETIFNYKQQIINAANFSRYEKSIYHDEINRKRLETFRNNRRLYNRQKYHQNIRKIKEQQRLSESRQQFVKEKSHRFITEYEKIQEIDEQFHQKKMNFAQGLRKAINQYNRSNKH